MKGLSILAAFLGGAVVGAAAGILFAPESGEDTRSKIADALRKRGIKLSRTDMENLVDEIAAEVNKSPKSVDNAVQRIRRNLAQHFSTGDFSKR